MKDRVIFMLTLMLCSLLVIAPVQIAASTPEAIYVLPIKGDISPGEAGFVARVLKDAEKSNSAVLIEIDTFGGRVDAATEIRDLIIRMKMPVVVYVQNRAWSAGALITLAAPHIAMYPGSSIGAAEPQPTDEKTVSALRAEFESTAEVYGRDPQIAAAMVDINVEIPGLVSSEQILALSAHQALELGYADLITSSRDEVLKEFGLDELPIIQYYPNWAERVASFLTGPLMSSLLLAIGFLGIIFEVMSPGWGVSGTVGVIALVLFFGGRLVIGLAGLEVIILFIVGLGLIAVEVFVVPGFGIVGILGIIALFVSLFLAFGSITSALWSIVLALLISILVIVLFWRRFTQSRVWRRLVLEHREDKESGYKGTPTYNDLVGKRGVTVTPLRPSGTALIEGQRYSVVSDGGFIKTMFLLK